MAPEQTGPQMSVMTQPVISESGTKTYDRSTEQEAGQTGIFDNVEAIAYKQWEEEERNVKGKIESVIQEIQLLLLENKLQTEEWRRVLGQEDLLPVISHKKFLKEFGDWQMGKVDSAYFHICIFGVEFETGGAKAGRTTAGTTGKMGRNSRSIVGKYRTV